VRCRCCLAHLDANLCELEKEQAAATWKKTFGHHPMTAWADHGEAGNGEPLAIVLRPGNAGPDTAAGHVEAARLALAQLPRHLRRRVLVRADSGGGTREFLKWLTAQVPVLRRHDHHRRHRRGDRQGPGGRVDPGL
jgi:hypothetical protein